MRLQSALIVGLAFAGAAVAAPEPAYAPYKDWRLACGLPNERDCFLDTDFRDPATHAKMAEFVIARSKDAPSQEVALISVPLTVLLKPGLDLRLGSVTKNVPYSTCTSTACEALLPMTQDLAGALAKARSAAITVETQSGKRVTFPLSMRGYSTARQVYLKLMHDR